MKRKLEIEENKAKELYKTASSEFKILLENTFGKEFFNEKITDRIKTWEDIVYFLNEKHNSKIICLPYTTSPLTKEQRSINALYKIQCISEVLNEGWKDDWNNTNQYKYIPYFYKDFGSGWLVGSIVWRTSIAYYGFGCYFKSSELALYAGKQFLDIYKEYLPE